MEYRHLLAGTGKARDTCVAADQGRCLIIKGKPTWTLMSRHSGHTLSMRRTDAACGQCAPVTAPVVPPACADPLRGSASAVPDLTLTPRGPRGRGRERLRQWWCSRANRRGRNHQGTSPHRTVPRRFLPRTPTSLPLRPTLRAGGHRSTPSTGGTWQQTSHWGCRVTRHSLLTAERHCR
jgi:hypothetical protein